MRKLILIITLVFITNCFASAVDNFDSNKSETTGVMSVSTLDTSYFSSIDGVELNPSEMKEVKGEGGIGMIIGSTMGYFMIYSFSHWLGASFSDATVWGGAGAIAFGALGFFVGP